MTETVSRLSGLIKGSIAWHLAGAAALAAAPSLWPMVVSALIADHVLIALAGIVPRAQVFGPCLSRLTQAEGGNGRVALTFDDGPDPEVTPAVLEILKDRGVSATFFPIGRRAAAHPSLVEKISAAGHRLGNHSWSHSPTFFFHSIRRMTMEIDRSQELLEGLGSQRPTHFRAPAGVRGPFLQPILERRALSLTAWSARGYDTTDTNPSRVLKRLSSRLKPGAILLLHDGSSARAPDGRAVVLHVLPRLLDEFEARGLTPVALT